MINMKTDSECSMYIFLEVILHELLTYFGQETYKLHFP
jgi:hypothetical protein